MTVETISTATLPGATIHPGWVRACHRINALAILVMIGSGWQIYDPRRCSASNSLARSRSATGSAAR